MILYEITRSEDNPIYKELEVSNGQRHYDFLRSIVIAALQTGRPFLSSILLKSLNFHAIACLHTNAGQYRPCQVYVGNYQPPEHFRVGPLMDDLINSLNRNWENTDPVTLASYVLWRINHIHPFINGNGRTARAAAYFVLCVSAGGWLVGETILPELLRVHRKEYVEALQKVDASYDSGNLDLNPLIELMGRLLTEQLSTAKIVVDGPDVSDEVKH